METLGYGSYLNIDAFIGNGAVPASTVEAFLGDMAELLEPGKGVAPEIHPVADMPTGLSAALLLPESHASIHLFEAERVLNLRVFSRHGLDLSEVAAHVQRTFGARRLESHLGNYSRTLSKEPDRRLKTLLGERTYTASRLLGKRI